MINANYVNANDGLKMGDIATHWNEIPEKNIKRLTAAVLGIEYIPNKHYLETALVKDIAKDERVSEQVVKRWRKKLGIKGRQYA